MNAMLTAARAQSTTLTPALQELRAQVLTRVYESASIEPLEGFQVLCAKHRKTNVGIYVVEGDFNRAQFKLAIQEARLAGINDRRLYVYGRTGSYSGNAICFCKFEEIGISY